MAQGRLRADATRNRGKLLEVARRHLAAGDDLQMNVIAREAGVGVATAYRRFPTTQALVEAIAEDGLALLLRHIEEAAEAADAQAGLAAAMRVTLTLQRECLGLSDVLACPAAELPEVAALKIALERAVDRLLDRARTEGVVRPGLTADDLRRLLCGIDHAIRSNPAPPDMTEQYLNILVQGIRPAAS
ncbi:TetR/AcrR family transcriptional regulator [Sphaerisporangium fuscum]|uniref:TetR/AcrR family transcriptional regulator n=1 Tax=Sphaerisporangium fuscum TaxID=2835868 RepID=UPI001BDC2034|nr:TetR/AcrR family transcriptional regulator [Sphaerisporangium fuscum]